MKIRTLVDSGDNTLRILPGTKAPRLYRTPLDKNHSSKAVQIVRRFRCAVSRLFGVSTQDFFNRIRGDPSLLAGVPARSRIAAWAR
jgi:hypothetical protein